MAPNPRRSGVRNSATPSSRVSRSPRSTLSAIGNSAGSRTIFRFSATAGGTLFLEAPNGERHIVPAKSKAVRERGAHVTLGRLVRRVIEVELRIRRLIVD